jgi:hypothetical protein
VSEPVVASLLLTYLLGKLRDTGFDVIGDPIKQKLKLDKRIEKLREILERAYREAVQDLMLPEAEYRGLLEPLLDALRFDSDPWALLYAADSPVYREVAIARWEALLPQRVRDITEQVPGLLPDFASKFNRGLRHEAENKDSSLAAFAQFLKSDALQRSLDLLLRRGDPGSFEHRFEEFRKRYMTQQFVGRHKVSDKLDRWLADEQSAPYLLLTAEAGRGKSALLVRWNETLETTHIFVPISIWGKTNSAAVALGSLARWLAIQHGLLPAELAFGTPEQLERDVRSLLSRDLSASKKGVVILDGLDEASDWDPDFPAHPGAGFRIVVSARLHAGLSTSQLWKEHLKLPAVEDLSLSPLEEKDVEELIAAFGFDVDNALAHQLFLKTEGDPLLLQLYGRELSKGGWTATNISKLQPGYKGFFDQWWEEQRKLKKGAVTTGLQHVLSVLSLAEGPLSFEDIAELLAVAAGMGKAETDQELRNLDRLLLGGHHINQPYTFVHDRLRFYFRDELVGKAFARQTWNRHFIEWGASVLQRLSKGEMPPNEVPEYLLLHYSEHLGRLPDTLPELYFELLSNVWREAARQFYPSESTYFLDAGRVLGIAQGLGIEAIGQQTRALLCRTSISAEGDSLPPDQLRARVERQQASVEWALDIARRKSSARERSTYLAALAPIAPEQSAEVLNESIGEARGVHAFSGRREALLALIPALSEGHFPLIWDAAMELSEPFRIDPLLALAQQPKFQAQRQIVLAAALECIKLIRDEYFAAEPALKLCELSTGKMQEEAVEQGCRCARRMVRDQGCAVYIELLHLARPIQRPSILRELKRKSRKLPGPWRILAEIDTLGFVQPPYHAKAVTTLSKLVQAYWRTVDAQLRHRVMSIPELAEVISFDSLPQNPASTPVKWPALRRPETLSPIPSISHQSKESDVFCRAIGRFSDCASEASQRKVADALLETLSKFPELKPAIASLAGQLLSSHMDAETRSHLLAEVRDDSAALAGMLRSRTISSRKKTEIIQLLLARLHSTVMPEAELESLAVAITTFDNQSKRVAWLSSLELPELPAGLLALRTAVAKTDLKWTMASGLKAILSTPNLEQRTRQILEVAEVLPIDIRTDQVRDAVQWVRRIKDVRKRGLLFCRLSDFLADVEAKHVLRKAVRAFEKIEDSTRKRRVARQIVLRVDESQVDAFLREAVPELDTRKPNVDAQFFWRDFVEYASATHRKDHWLTIIHAVWTAARIPESGDSTLKLFSSEITKTEWLSRLASLAQCFPDTQRRRLSHEIHHICVRRKGELAGQTIIEMGAAFPTLTVLEFCPDLLSNAAVTEMMADARRRTRSELYSLLAGLAPVICSIGGGRAADQVLDALVDTAKWWPLDRV